MKPHTKIVLTKMCEFAHVDMQHVNFKTQSWRKFECGKRKMEWFKVWFSEYLKNSCSARIELMPLKYNNNKDINNFVEYFIKTYGFKTTKPCKLQD